MKRVFDLDVLECPKCRSRMQRIGFDTASTADSPQIGLAPGGEGIAVWVQGTVGHIWANWFR